MNNNLILLGRIAGQSLIDKKLRSEVGLHEFKLCVRNKLIKMLRMNNLEKIQLEIAQNRVCVKQL